MFRTEMMEINMGPQHPSTHGVLRLELTLDGETVVDVRPVIGYLHRGVEKLSEHKIYVMIPPLCDRLDYVASGSQKDRKSTRLNSSHRLLSRMPSSA